jgi:hypothetical protein
MPPILLFFLENIILFESRIAWSFSSEMIAFGMD